MCCWPREKALEKIQKRYREQGWFYAYKEVKAAGPHLLTTWHGLGKVLPGWNVDPQAPKVGQDYDPSRPRGLHLWDTPDSDSHEFRVQVLLEDLICAGGGELVVRAYWIDPNDFAKKLAEVKAECAH